MFTQLGEAVERDRKKEADFANLRDRELAQEQLDRFAGQAMAAFIDAEPYQSPPETIARLAYKQAKAMMAEREKNRI